MDNTASVAEVRNSLADVIDRATRDELTIVTRRGQQVAAVVPIEMVREWRRWEEERVLAIINGRRDSPSVSMEEVFAETLARPE